MITTIYSWLNNEKKLMWFIILITITLRIPTLLVEVFNGDETDFATAAIVILDGGIPYVDFVEKKPPLLYYFYSLTFKVFGVDLRFVHLMVLLCVLGTSFFLYKSLTLFSFEKAGLLSAMFYGLFSCAFIEQDMWAANAEILMNFPMILSIYFFLKGTIKGSPFSLFHTGFCLALAILLKHQAGILYPLFLLALIYFNWGKGLNNLLIKVFIQGFILLIGSLIPIALIIVYFYSVGHLKEFYLWNFTYNFDYIGEGPHFMESLVKGSARTIAFILSTFILWFLPCYFFKERKNIFSFPKDVFFFFGLWVLFTFPAVFVGGRFWGHYYILFYPPISALGGLGAWYFLNQIEKHSKKVKILFLIGLIFSPLFFEILGITRFFTGGYQSAKPFIKEVSQYVEKETNPNDKIFSWGQFPYPYYYAKRLPASRFITCEYLVPYWKNRFNKDKGFRPDQLEPYHIENWNILMRDLEVNKPRLIIDVQGTKHLDNWDLYEIRLFPQLHEFIKKNYVLKQNIEGVLIYKKKS